MRALCAACPEYSPYTVAMGLQHPGTGGSGVSVVLLLALGGVACICGNKQ